VKNPLPKLPGWAWLALAGLGGVLLWKYAKGAPAAGVGSTPAGGSRAMHTSAHSQPTAPSVGQLGYSSQFTDANPDPLAGTYPYAGGVGVSGADYTSF